MEKGTLKESKSWAMFALSGPKLRPQEITDKLGLKADYAQGMETLTWENRPAFGHWQLNSQLGPEAPLDEHIWDILKKLAPVRKELKEFTQNYEATVYASVEFVSEFTTGITLGKRTLLLLGELGVQLEITPWDSNPSSEV